MIRRKLYQRTEKVLLKDMLKGSIDSEENMTKVIVKALEDYMKVYDMHVKFNKLDNGKYSIRIDGIVSNINIPSVI